MFMLAKGLLIAGALLAVSASASAVTVCGLNEAIDLTRLEPLPFGGEVLGIGPEGGQIIGATFDVTFTATGQFDAADLGVWLVLNLHSGGAAFGFTGAQLSWQGQGTFTAHLESNALNGYINSFGNPFSTWLIDMANLNPGNGPITGSFDELVFKLIYAPCPVGDINHDASVNVNDLLTVINAWGSCPAAPAECPADITGDAQVNVSDLLAVINHWQTFCPNCK